MWCLEQHKENTALIDESGRTLSYRKLDEETKRIAEAVGRRSLVFSLCRNTIGSVLGYVAFINGNILPVLLSSHLEETLRASLMQAYQPAFLWIPAEQADRFAEMEPVYSCYDYVLLHHFTTF